jgi:hypothetical protein
MEGSLVSEYQYYEFRAIDRPLDEKAMAALRQITSRAEITPTSLINEYHWGDFKGDPRKLVSKYFDAFLYFANWGTHELMLRMPGEILDMTAIEPYCVPYRVGAKQDAQHIVLDFTSGEDCRDDEEWRDWRLGGFLSLRADLMAGDLRCLYLAWLSAVANGEVEDDVLEPPVPPGLQTLSGPLTDFAEFLYLDPDMIATAAEASTTMPKGPTSDDVEAWVASLADAEKDRALVRVMQGEGLGLANELLIRFRRAQKRREVEDPGQERRMARTLREKHELRRHKREQLEAERAAREKKQQEQKQAAARAKHFESLQGQEAKLWRQVDQLVTTKQPQKYDEAVSLLKDLHELWRSGTGMDFTQPMRALLEQHSAKSSFKRRVKQAGLAP